MKSLPLLLFILVKYSFVFSQLPSIEITAGNYDRLNCPVTITLQKVLSSAYDYVLKNKKNGHRIAIQFSDSTTFIFILDEKLIAGSKANYSLQRSKVPRKIIKHAIDTTKGLQLSIDNKPVLFYNSLIATPPADSPAYYRRSGFIHPLYSPSGKILTDDFPAGHAHQHAIFMTWTNTTFKNAPLDFWNQHLQRGTVEHIQIIDFQDGPVFTRFRTRLRHKSFIHGEVLQEVWTVTLYKYSNDFVFDLHSVQENVSTDTLFLNKYHYGGLAFRGSRQWNKNDTKHFSKEWTISTSEGGDIVTANQKPAKWVDASGVVDNVWAGVTVFDHPANFRYPQPIRVHPDMPYWCYAPMIDGPFYIAPKAKFSSTYRYLVHDGPVNILQIKEMEANWKEPPRIRVMY